MLASRLQYVKHVLRIAICDRSLDVMALPEFYLHYGKKVCISWERCRQTTSIIPTFLQLMRRTTRYLCSALIMAALRSSGHAIMFCSCDLLLLLFRALVFEAEERRPAGPLQDVGMRCNFITQIRGDPICIHYILMGENLKILPTVGRCATMKSCNLKTRLQMQKLKQIR